MNSWRVFKEAIESLASNKLRTALTMLGIVIGVTAVLSMTAIGQGASSSITSSIESMGTNLLFVSRAFSDNNSNPQALTLSDAEALIESGGAPSVAAVAPVVNASRTVVYGDNSTSTTIMGVTPDYASVRKVSVSSGRFIDQKDIDSSSTVAILGNDVVEDLFGSDVGVIGQKIRIGNMLYEVVGILESSGGTFSGSSDNQIIVPITTAFSRLVARSNANDEVDMIYVSAVDSESMSGATSEITSILRSRHKISSDEDDDFNIMSQESMTEAASSITGVLTVFLGGIAAISLLVGGIGIMNIMLVSVIERTKEIGLRKAVGAKNKDILLQFMTESLIIGLAGGLLGIILAYGLAAIIGNIAAASNFDLNPVITFGSILLAVGFSMAVGLIFGIYPASRASKLEPVEALRTE
ncbi:ABC transporter permease [Pelolinea submarina]|uniref:Putative ABC transport system permease protein n=1 Tax=Pelolinea submarina TaxID=913107 RepID=A0A347ZPQ4_9CHLR|nr:ABC transporter permease [Pelolinea submarina]REG04700.1 putative ABC transport system permease protein [Pelolinea submarina]BBB47285.1 ABC transport system permease protein [Pelolinea submarina]